MLEGDDEGGVDGHGLIMRQTMREVKIGTRVSNGFRMEIMLRPDRSMHRSMTSFSG